MKKCAQLKIIGRVQNVGFRYNTQVIANEYNIGGYVKNMLDGSVFVEAEGEEADLERFIGWCKKGPSWSHVENVEVEYIPLSGFNSFNIR